MSHRLQTRCHIAAAPANTEAAAGRHAGGTSSALINRSAPGHSRKQTLFTHCSRLARAAACVCVCVRVCVCAWGDGVSRKRAGAQLHTHNTHPHTQKIRMPLQNTPNIQKGNNKKYLFTSLTRCQHEFQGKEMKFKGPVCSMWSCRPTAEHKETIVSLLLLPMCFLITGCYPVSL